MKKRTIIFFLVLVSVVNSSLISGKANAENEHFFTLILKTNGWGVLPNYCLFIENYLREIGIDVERMAQKVADAINNAQAGAIIDQSEEQVRDAHAELRQKTYQKAISLLEKNQQAFSPSAQSSEAEMEK